MAARQIDPIHATRGQVYMSTIYINPYAHASGFTPPASAVMWLEAENITGLSDGDPVATWPVVVGYGSNATQATESLKPLYKVGSFSYVRFDGVNDVMSFNTLSLSDFTIFTVNTRERTSNREGFLGDDNDGMWGHSNDPRRYRFQANSSGSVYQWFVAAESLSIYQLHTLKRSGSDVTHWKNGGQETNFTADAFMFAPLVLGAMRSGGVNVLQSDIAAVLVCNAALNDTDRLAVETYLNGKYSIY